MEEWSHAVAAHQPNELEKITHLVGELVANHANTHLRDGVSPYASDYFKPWIESEERPPQKIGRSDAEINASYARIGL